MAITNDAFSPSNDMEQLFSTSPYPLALCDQNGTILQASPALLAAESNDAKVIGKPVQSVFPNRLTPQLMGQFGEAQYLYGWIPALHYTSSEEEIADAIRENQSFRLALEQIGLYVFEYHIDRDSFHLLTSLTSEPPTQLERRGGPEVIAAYLQLSEEDSLYFVDAFANAAFGRGTSLDVLSRITGADQWLRLTLSPIFRDAHMTGVVIGTMQNITAQKLTEQQVSREAAFRNNVLAGISSGWELNLESGSWSHLWNGEPVLSFLSQAQMHYEQYDAFLSETMCPLIHSEDWESYAAIMARGALLARFRRGEHTCSVEYRIRRRPSSDDVYEWRNVTVRLSRDPATLQPKASCHVTDISPQKANELEEQRQRLAMERTARDERRANARKSQFLADTARTLHGPLQAMAGVAMLALQEEMSPTAREYLQQLHDFGDDLTSLLGDVLALADSTPHQDIPTDEEYSPLALLERVSEITKNHTNAAAKLITVLDGIVPSSLFGDSMRLQQALINLSRSALYSSPEVELHFSCIQLDAEHANVRVQLIDRYHTLSDAQLENIFVAFSQTDDCYGGGTGLGMSLARQLVRLMGGSLTAERMEGGGVSFLLTVPHRIIDTRPIEF